MAIRYTSSFGGFGKQQGCYQLDEWCWEVKGDEHAVPVRGVVHHFVRWFLGGTFRPRTDENDWCRRSSHFVPRSLRNFAFEFAQY